MPINKFFDCKERELSSQSVDGKDSTRPKRTTDVLQHFLLMYLKKVKVRWLSKSVSQMYTEHRKTVKGIILTWSGKNLWNI